MVPPPRSFACLMRMTAWWSRFLEIVTCDRPRSGNRELVGVCGSARQMIDAVSYDDLSQGSVRFGQPRFADAYSLAAFSINGITLSLIGSIQSDALVHFVPSHWAR
jgi:hypothetical protein